MEWIILSLLSLSVILFILSLFQKNPTDALEKQVENLSIQVMQEIYYLKKKMKALEDEYMLDNDASSESSHENALNKSRQLTRDDVLALYEEGLSIEEIASMTSYDIDDIDALLAN